MTSPDHTPVRETPIDLRARSVRRALVELRATGEPPRLRDIARTADLPTPTARRYLMKLIDRGEVVQSDWGTYDVAPSPLPADDPNVSLACIVPPSARAELIALQRATRQAVLLYVPVLGQRVCVYRALGKSAVVLESSRAEVLWQSPVDADPAGFAMLPAPHATAEELLHPAYIRADGCLWGPSQLDGWDMIASPVGPDEGPRGSVCVLMPATSAKRGYSGRAEKLRRTAQAVDRALFAATSPMIGDQRAS